MCGGGGGLVELIKFMNKYIYHKIFILIAPIRAKRQDSGLEGKGKGKAVAPSQV